ncbi:uracil phosphoribosyltransferase [Exophiala viscosa]|uniref:uracil phosphoribosyltransferase n=1 Tax=Exophiala viscosa TaxID=2486360 RepID=A0AAN6E4D8_9EURO|nr:uracil phosphoribosyltransferase [Exophiala viscosa]KAI1629999.1 uracil phosphoribosyltransferase [Exophiala viscosa]
MSKDVLPSNVRVLSSPAFAAKLAILRDRSIKPRAVRKLTAELSTILAAEAFSAGSTASKAALIVVLRAGLAMQDPFLDQAPSDLDVFVYHLGLFRDTVTLEPVEYYNKLPTRDRSIKHAYIVDPLIATGGTAAATINILRSWGVEHITFLSILASRVGLEQVANTWPEGTDFLVGVVDEDIDEKGYIVPGLGDIGDRLYRTK